MPKAPAKRQRALRSDAARNAEQILESAAECLRQDPDASMAQIAAAAGLGRITLYGHYPTRAALIEAVMRRALDDAHVAMAAVDLDGPPARALQELTARSWQMVDRFRGVLAAAQREMPAELIHEAHDRVLKRIGDLVARGQEAGVFRTDLPASWLMSAAIGLMHTAAQDVAAGRLDADAAPDVLVRSLGALYTPVGKKVAAPVARG